MLIFFNFSFILAYYSAAVIKAPRAVIQISISKGSWLFQAYNLHLKS